MKHVLVIEDEPVIRALIAASLDGECRIDTVADGRDALTTIETDLPDLILLDVGLPGLSGDEVLRRLRSDDKTAAIPVLMLTGLEPPDGIDADGVVRKPFTPQVLRESVGPFLC